MSEVITEFGVRFAIDSLQIRRWQRYACPVCDERLSYKFIDSKVYWDPRCACNGHDTPLVERDCAHLAAFFNAHSDAERLRLWEQFVKSRGPKCDAP